ncbi:unnamed protein product [Cuscuta epithymum]|uniref:Aspergillus nuclease S1 n=1 Tax=Cuscuta epithymum TaxID=186058 RepID=A0AAV0DYR6_9ASTE|nr:unnamed protein product [Cuscuta epithymum]CAH9146343.1 unnamed protein product [Cuscuta epithymum]
MEQSYKGYYTLAMAALWLLLIPAVRGWGTDGHMIACRIAESRLSSAAAVGVEELLGAASAERRNLSSLCSWADNVKFVFPWSSALHYINTPDHLCSYRYNRDCKDEGGEMDRCVAGAINNYTSQLVNYAHGDHSSYNATQALLFLSHFLGDIHQVWDTSIIETAEEQIYDSQVEELIDAIEKNISNGWASKVKSWEACSNRKEACPDVYASEGIEAACNWAYKGVEDNSVLGDDYFSTRLPIVQLRLAQAGVRLAAILNRIFG